MRFFCVAASWIAAAKVATGFAFEPSSLSLPALDDTNTPHSSRTTLASSFGSPSHADAPPDPPLPPLPPPPPALVPLLAVAPVGHVCVCSQSSAGELHAIPACAAP